MQIDPRKVVIHPPDDFHVHLRQGNMTKLMVAVTSQAGFVRVLAMPNTRPPILTAEDLLSYKGEVQEAIDLASFVTNQEVKLEVLMTAQLTEDTTPEQAIEAVKAGAIAFKVYPKNMTTHSENGVFDYDKILPVLEVLEERGVVACFHGEHPSDEYEGLDKEAAFLEVLEGIIRKFPNLKIVLEHITTFDSVQFVRETGRNVAATITAHHLVNTLDDVIGYSERGGYLMRPHNMCKPVAKMRADREALVDAAISGDRSFFFGSDSAPHVRGSKECAGVCAGCFTTPCALPTLAHVFESREALQNLDSFVSINGATFYGLPLNAGGVVLEKNPMIVPESFSLPDGLTVVPWRAGEEIPWRVV